MQAASQNGHVDVLKLLLKHNVDLEAEVIYHQLYWPFLNNRHPNWKCIIYARLTPSLCGCVFELRTKMEIGQCTMQPLVMRALSLRCCRGVVQT